MKKVLSLLLTFVVLQNESWAMRGPVYNNGAGMSTAGTYAGALLPIDSSTNVDSADGFNGLGIFAIVIPVEGLGVGAFYYFSQGNAFVGNVDGIADPEGNSFVAVVNGQASLSVSSTNSQAFGNSTVTQATATVGGGIFATFSQDESGFATSGTGVRLNGTADLEVIIPGTAASTTTDAAGKTVSVPAASAQMSALQLVVDGFQQSTTTTALSITGFPSLGGAAAGS